MKTRYGMNTARLARGWSEAAGDPAQTAEARGEEIDDPAASLVYRDYLDKVVSILVGNEPDGER